MRIGVSYLVYIYTLGAGRILIKSIIIVCLFNLMAWKASWAHRTGENENKKIMMKKKKVGPNVERLWFVSDLIGNPEDWFSQNEAHMCLSKTKANGSVTVDAVIDLDLDLKDEHLSVVGYG